MKKDLDWFKDQLDNIEMNTPSLWAHKSIWMLDRVNELLDQLDKPDEREQLEIAYKDILERGEFWFDDKKYKVVEVEQKYYVMNNDNRMMLCRKMDGKTITEADPFKLEAMYEGEKESHRLTEQEIKDYDERYFAFAVKVEELEE